MQNMRLDSAERIATDWAGAGNAANGLQRAVTNSKSAFGAAAAREANADGSSADKAKAMRGWTRTLFRFVRNAAVGLLLLTAVPIAVVAYRGSHPVLYNQDDLGARMMGMDHLRELLPKDASITPLQAGQAFRRLQIGAGSKEFPAPTIAAAHDRPWKTYPLTGNMFAERLTFFRGPSPRTVIRLAKNKFSVEEMKYLQTVAEAGVWRDFDMVGSADGVDLIGGSYALPFRDQASVIDLPMTRFADMKELAYAGEARAAYYLAVNQPEKAKAALESVISFGLAMIDNGTNSLDALIGRVIVGVGLDGMNQFNTVTGQRVLTEQEISFTNRIPRGSTPVQRVTAASVRQHLLADAANPLLPHSLRFDALRGLSFASCGNVQEMLFGPKEDIRQAFFNASTSLARYPSEKAYIDLLLGSADHVSEVSVHDWLPDQLRMGAAIVAATVTNNPRIAACTRAGLANW